MAVEAIHFLMSSERGGSNMMSRMIGAHSHIACPPPAHLLRTFIPLANGHRTWSEVLDLALALFKHKLAPWHVDISRQALEQAVPEHDTAALFRYFYEQEAAAVGKSFAFVKEVRTYNLLPFIQHFYPESKIVYLVRDPRDMALSWKKSLVHRGAVVRGASVWHKDQTRSLAAQMSLKMAGKIILVRYEDLLEDPRKELMRISDFLRVDFQEGMLSFHQGASERKMGEATASWSNVSAPLMRDNFNKFKAGLSDDEISYVETLNGELMAQLGYEATLSPLSHDEFKAVEQRLASVEPWDKPAYQSVSPAERAGREAWQRLAKSIDPLTLF